jgi:hypothetical protein
MRIFYEGENNDIWVFLRVGERGAGGVEIQIKVEYFEYG